MKRVAQALSLLPFGILVGFGWMAWEAEPGHAAAAAVSELPPNLQLAPADRPPPPPRPAPPADGALEGSLELASQIPLGEPLPVLLEVRNTGGVPLTQVVAWLPLPEGVRTPALARYLRFSTPRLAPGEVVEHRGQLITTRPGTLSLEARFRSAEQVEATAGATVRLATAVLTLREAEAPGAAEPCVVVANLGGAAARDVLIRLRGPGGSRTHRWPSLEAGAERVICFDTLPAEPAPGDWEVEVSSRAADPVRLTLSARPEER